MIPQAPSIVIPPRQPLFVNFVLWCISGDWGGSKGERKSKL
jgi:hypothetical protein